MFSPLLGFAQGQVDCSLLSVTDVIIQNDSITFEILNSDTMDTHYPYVSYTLDANGDTIQKGYLNYYMTFAGTSSFYYYTNFSPSFVMDSLTEFNVNYPLSIFFTYSNLTGENYGDYTCELYYNPQNNSSSCEANLIEGCSSIGVWDPVCGCDGETYSNSGDAACHSIYEYTSGECIETIYGCTNPINQFNYDPSATVDDGSCVPFVFGCTNIMANNYDIEANIDDGSCEWLDCEGELSYTSLNNLVEDSVCHSNLYCDVYDWDGGDCVFDCNDDFMTLWDIDTYFYNGQCDQILNCMVYNFDNESCIEGPNAECGGISITINNGWNMIGFSCSENTDAIEAFYSIQEKIIIAKDASGNAYLPSFNFNGIGDLERGYGYLLKVTDEINNYNICE